MKKEPIKIFMRSVINDFGVVMKHWLVLIFFPFFTLFLIIILYVRLAN